MGTKFAPVYATLIHVLDVAYLEEMLNGMLNGMTEITFYKECVVYIKESRQDKNVSCECFIPWSNGEDN